MTSWNRLRNAFMTVTALVAGFAFWAAPADADNLDLRGNWTLRWMFPAPAPNQAPVDGFELRLSSDPPGSDIEAWWSAAEPQSNLPASSGPGAAHVWKREGLNSGVTFFAAVRTVDSEGHCSPLTADEVVSWTPPSEPFLQEVQPTEIASCVRQTFNLVGMGLENTTSVILHSNGKTYSAQKVRPNAGVITAVVNLPSLDRGPVDIEVVTPGGSDILRGWVWVTEKTTANGNGSVNPAAASEPLQVWRDGSGWRVQLDEPTLSSSSTEAQGGGCGNGNGSTALEPKADAALLLSNSVAPPRIRVFDVSGRVVADLQPRLSGEGWETHWDGSAANGRRVASGIFFLRAETGGRAWNRKVFIVR